MKIQLNNKVKVPKKYLILLIYNILETYSDERNLLTQIEIANIIVSFNFDCDRKTVGRNIHALIELGYPIIKKQGGYYLDKKKFTLAEVDFIKNAILSYSNKTFGEKEKEDLLNKLLPLVNKIYRK